MSQNKQKIKWRNYKKRITKVCNKKQYKDSKR